MPKFMDHGLRPRSPGRRAIVLALFAIPALGYGFLKIRNKSIAQEARNLEEQGRRSFSVGDEHRKSSEYGVNVGRSGGGV